MLPSIKKYKNLFIMVFLGIIILYVSSNKNTYINESFIRARINNVISNQPNQPNQPLNPPSYFTSCGDATQYGCSTCLSAVVQNAPSTKCGWTDTGHLVNGNQKQYICESGGSQKCP